MSQGFQLPEVVERWFAERGWAPRRHQLDMLALAQAGRSGLLVAATGAGKTLAGFLPTICELAEAPAEGLHTLYVSPLKALAVDVQRNLHRPDRGDGPADPRRDPHRRHAVGPQGAPAGAAAADPADHARIAEPALELSRQRDPVRGAQEHRRRRAARLRQGEARRPAGAVDRPARETGAGPAPGRAVGDDQRSRSLSRLARPRRRHRAGRPRHRRSGRRAGPVDPDPREPDPLVGPFAAAMPRAR